MDQPQHPPRKPLRYFDTFSGIGGFSHAIGNVFGNRAECVGYSDIDPYASRIYQRNFPRHQAFGDIAAIDPDQVPDFDLLTAGFPCYPEGVNILTQAGFKDISKVEVGDLVLTHRNRWRRVYQTMQRSAPTIRLKGHGCPGIVTTHEHPFWSVASSRVWNNDRRATDRVFSEPEWTPAKDMSGRYWASPCVFPADAVPQMEHRFQERAASIPEMNVAFFRFVGLWLGDGWIDMQQRAGRPIGQTNGKTFVCSSREQGDYVAQMLTDTGLHFLRHEERTTERFIICSKPITRWLAEQFGRYAHGKTVPAWVLGMDESFRAALLDGYLFADGHSKDAKHRAATVSHNLACGIKLLAQSLGYSVAVHNVSRKRTATIEDRIISERRQWEIVIEEKGRISQRIGEHIFSLCRETTDTGIWQTVYNLSVEEDESYLADTLVVHNCTDLSIGNRENLGLQGARSGLIREAMRILEAKNPRHFIVENVASMKDKNVEAISRLLGVDPVMLDAAHVSPQQRKRLFWTNFPVPPLQTEKGHHFGDVLLPDPPPHLNLSERELAYMSRTVNGGRSHWGFYQHHDSTRPRSQCLTANLHKGVPYNVLLDHRYQVPQPDGTTGPLARKLHPIEAERLMGLPDDFTAQDIDGRAISTSRRLRALGNGVSVPVIEHIARALDDHGESEPDSYGK